MNIEHWAVFLDNTSQKSQLITSILKGTPPKILQGFQAAKGALFSKLAIERYIDEEDRHDTKILTADTDQALRSMSSGEQKKALLKYILSSDCDFIVLDNPFDNLDTDTQAHLKMQLETVSKQVGMIQLISRKSDLLSFIDNFARLKGDQLVVVGEKEVLSNSPTKERFTGQIPLALNSGLNSLEIDHDVLIELKSVNVSYMDKPVLKDINWSIKKGDFWELRGKNGSGKTTILSMITGENPKGYGQDLYIFGQKKGSGESVWDIKKKIGYFTPSMTDKFTGYHSVEHMLISGLNDSIGLYIRPTEVQLRTAEQWLQLIDLWHVKDALYHDLSMGQKRLVMCARAMIKHPPLLIFDEPTAGLDDASAALFVALVNKFAKESQTTIIFVSHRKEPDLRPDHIYHLEMKEIGSSGKVVPVAGQYI
ncbi:ATP-binding cassette domain-containing protein [Pricia sp. S334]|uniref:ATP-binding cassette domain-containing protein n=1 Tax=Pricia mediterranea TaxID=3076079 RepID=A0ABU3L2V3_9FLAO|nr:ATP-binding cassette domain-containing protein [Pricia sp. S334]MDT7827728.1 ATP-binding cassette domain-containing protein [Pricia sp. S334]